MFGLVRQLFEPLFSAPELAVFREPMEHVRDALTETGSERLVLHRLQPAVERLTRELARHAPVLICVDDIHWADAPSLACLAHLTRHTARQPVLMAMTRCPQILDTGSDGLAEMRMRPDCIRIQPDPLDQRHVGLLISDVLRTGPNSGFTAFCHAVTQGNPQTLIELLDAMSATGMQPSSGAEELYAGVVAEVTTRRAAELLRRQPDHVQELIAVLAVLDDHGVDVAPDLIHVELVQVQQWIEELVKLGILRWAPTGRPMFASERLCAAVRTGLSVEVRDDLRIRAGHALSVRGAPIEHVAAAVQGTQPIGDPWVIEILCEAARARTARGYPEEVAGYLQRVLLEDLEQHQRATLLRHLGSARLPGDPEAARHHFRESARLATSPSVRAAAVIGLCQAGLLTQQALEVTPELTGAIRDLATAENRTEADEEALVRLRAMLVIAHDRSPDSAFQEDGGGDPGPLDAPLVTPAECELLSAFAQQITERGGSAEEAAGLALRAMSGASLLDPGSHLPFIRSVNVLLYAEHLEAVMHWAGRMAEVGSHYRWRLLQLIGRCLRAKTAFRMGDLELSLSEARTAFEWTGLTDRSGYHTVALANLTGVLIELNRLDEAEGFLEQHGAASSGAPLLQSCLLAARSKLLVRRGDLDGALYNLLETGRLLSTIRTVNPAVVSWRSQAAELCAELGKLSSALELADEELTLARRWGTPRAIGIALRARGKVEEGAGGLRLLEEAVQVLKDSSARLELATAYAELGARYRVLGEATSARWALRKAATIAERCAAHALLARVHAELLSSGARPRTTVRCGPASLTPSERRVANLAARNYTNRKIAELLSVSPNTVEVHLTNTYRKLAISSRAKLADSLSLDPPRNSG